MSDQQPQILHDYDLGTEFEPTVLACMVNSPRFLQRYSSVVDPEAFTDENARFVVATLADYWKTYKRVPGRTVLDDIIRKSHHRDPISVIALLDDLPEVTDEQYVLDRLLKWIRWRTIDQALASEEARQDPKTFAIAIDKAARVGDSLTMEHTSLHEDRPDEQIQRPSIATPWPTINAKGNGGPQIGDLAFLITVINGGKTTGLVNIARHALSLGKYVVYLTFEDGEIKIKRRMMQTICGYTIENLLSNTKQARALRDYFLLKTGGRFEVKQIKSRRTSVADAIGFIRSLEDSVGRKVDMVISDYADRFRAPTKRQEPRHELREIAEECKYLAVDLDVVHWTASQSNKGQVGQEIVSIEHGSEAYGKFESCDWALGMGRTMEDARLGRTSLYSSKMRDAETGSVLSLIADYSKQRIYEPDDPTFVHTVNVRSTRRLGIL